MPSPQYFVCDCGGRYNTVQGLRQHQRRYCRGAPAENANLCSLCNVNFSTYMGYRQHLKRTHPQEYNENIQGEASRPNRLWTEDEVNDLARAEAGYEGEDLLAFLQSVSTRTLHALKNRRKLAAYKEKVARFREELSATRQPVSSGDTSPGRSRVHSELDRKLRNYISELNDLSASTSQMKTYILNSTAVEAKEKLDEWCDHLVDKYGRRRNRAATGDQFARSIQQLVDKINDPAITSRRRRALRYRLAQLKYKNNRKAYANELLDGLTITTDNTRPNSEDITVAYYEIFGSPSI